MPGQVPGMLLSCRLTKGFIIDITLYQAFILNVYLIA